MAITIYHNPRCSKSREALALLREHQTAPRVVAYLDTPPSVVELKNLVRLLGISARDLIRTGEPEYREMGLSDPTMDDDALLEVMAKHPRLIQRPIIVHGDRAIIGRPPHKVLDLL